MWKGKGLHMGGEPEKRWPLKRSCLERGRSGQVAHFGFQPTGTGLRCVRNLVLILLGGGRAPAYWMKVSVNEEQGDTGLSSLALCGTV